MRIFANVNENKDKIANSLLLHFFEANRVVGWKRCSSLEICDFIKRRSSFSPDLRSIGPSVFDGARSKVVLRSKGYAWTPIWWSSDNSNM